ncbi:D-alanyl-D-alanine carboxypeptidase/D-alanyl-D-alanine endopeptidase [Yoonia litorea]|uniref:D-alanyl-D-alanine carboxypeptidase / D-alanyl-D-alanine-endopeptidase (Penicillin-binding protein 4) n=1 Tax=Yoonia litorea TaxID=1123755 RepID=A0A1I6N1F4_9RHOB|nr:D-alanyl-D-alanine carboxypeptidase/D-alanyl-D-alanine-endopeptidase [Yoonia litorea]SFS21760.1 D-alanyl-D-alanine carboxypeptidase / D-alanyl-D-alanine-endopeptidase (penicillin-binding protein 4) [Yoonia litorea]
MRLTRRALLAGAGSTFASAALAEAPLTSLRPRARVAASDVITRLVANAGLSGETGVAVMDLATGAMIEDVAADVQQPPASVTKAVTALYALEAMGPNHRFTTRVFADGPVVNGVLDGNLILAGGGDPDLATDDIATLAARLKDTGLREVRGDFLVWDEALRNVDEIDPGQLDHFGYNPTITGLNLNYNRVHFEWRREQDGFATAIDARSENYRPAVSIAEVDLVDRDAPVFTYRKSGNVDRWTVARGSLNDEGSRWLPVRHPALYAGEVFATFMRSHGIVLSKPQETPVTPSGVVLAQFQSAPLTEQLRFMLRNSINLSAEVTGMAATKAITDRVQGMRTSALRMSRWTYERCGGVTPLFVDHSGLGDESRISPAEMVGILGAPNVEPQLYPVLRRRRVFDSAGQEVVRDGIAVQAKTGTLNFVSSLAGYVRTDKGRRLAFAIFSADLEQRAAGILSGAESPQGARGWGRRARTLQRDIISHLALRLPA